MSAKRINPRLAKLHRSYDVPELAILLGVHKHTVRGWIKSGLPTVDSTRPVLMLGCDIRDWLGKRRKAAKCRLKPGQFYCVKCRGAKVPAGGMVEYAATNTATGNLKAICESCGSMMNRKASLASLTAIMPKLDVQRREAPSSISERTHPSLNTDKPMEA